MGCQRVKIGDVHAIVCGPSARCKCGRRATRLCDFKVPAKKSGTCDAPFCARCSTALAPDKDLCPKHAAELELRGKRDARP